MSWGLGSDDRLYVNKLIGWLIINFVCFFFGNDHHVNLIYNGSGQAILLFKILFFCFFVFGISFYFILFYFIFFLFTKLSTMGISQLASLMQNNEMHNGTMRCTLAKLPIFREPFCFANILHLSHSVVCYLMAKIPIKWPHQINTNDALYMVEITYYNWFWEFWLMNKKVCVFWRSLSWDTVYTVYIYIYIYSIYKICHFGNRSFFVCWWTNEINANHVYLRMSDHTMSDW